MFAGSPRTAHACEHDDALAQAAASIALGDEPASPDLLLRSARDAGSSVVAVHSLRVRAGDVQRVDRWLAELSERADAPLICGRAQSERGTFVLAAERAASLEVDAGQAEARFTLAAGFDRPHLVVREESGRLVALAPQGHRFDLSGITLPATLQLLAVGPHGPRPVALRLVEGRVVEGRVVEGRAVEGPSGRVVGREAALDARVAELRRAAGTPALRPHRILGDAARVRAREVCESGRVAHVTRDGDPERRLARSGVAARVVGEVVARGATELAAMDALESSPAHQLALVDRRFTDVGIGTAHDERGRVCVVGLLASWPRLMGRAIGR